MNQPDDNLAPKSLPEAFQRAPSFHLTPGQIKRLPQWQSKNRGLLERSWSGKASPRTAIKVFCLDCMGEDKQAVADCGDRCCSLWKYRPYQKNRKDVV